MKKISSFPAPFPVLLLFSSFCAFFQTPFINMPLWKNIENMAEKKLAGTRITSTGLKLNVNIQTFDRLLDKLTSNAFNFSFLLGVQISQGKTFCFPFRKVIWIM